MTTPTPVTDVENVVKTAIADAVKAAGVVLVVLGLVPVIAQALGAAHIVVPSALLAYATIAASVVTGFVSWAKSKGIVAKIIG